MAVMILPGSERQTQTAQAGPACTWAIVENYLPIPAPGVKNVDSVRNFTFFPDFFGILNWR
jgi:hypothetical protein